MRSGEPLARDAMVGVPPAPPGPESRAHPAPAPPAAPAELKRVQQYVEQNYFVERELDKVVAADRARLSNIGAWRGRKLPKNN